MPVQNTTKLYTHHPQVFHPLQPYALFAYPLLPVQPLKKRHPVLSNLEFLKKTFSRILHCSFLAGKRGKHVHQTRSNNNKTIRDIQWMGKYDIQSLFYGNCLNGKELKKFRLGLSISENRYKFLLTRYYKWKAPIIAEFRPFHVIRIW